MTGPFIVIYSINRVHLPLSSFPERESAVSAVRSPISFGIGPVKIVQMAVQLVRDYSVSLS